MLLLLRRRQPDLEELVASARCCQLTEENAQLQRELRDAEISALIDDVLALKQQQPTATNRELLRQVQEQRNQVCEKHCKLLKLLV